MLIGARLFLLRGPKKMRIEEWPATARRFWRGMWESARLNGEIVVRASHARVAEELLAAARLGRPPSAEVLELLDRMYPALTASTDPPPESRSNLKESD